MSEPLKEALDQVRAGEELKEKTRAFLSEKTRGYQKAPAVSRRPALSAAACVLVLLCLGLWKVYFTPVSVISIDINPSLELSLNRFDRVLSVEGYNEDGQALAQALDVRFLNYRDAVEQVLASPAVADCLARDEYLSIAVVDDDAQRQQALLAGVQSCAAGHGQAHCYAADGSQLEEAHHAGLSYGKYQAYLELSALDGDITPQQVQSMTMREIRELIAALSSSAGDSAQDGSSQSAGQGPGTGSGQGSGQGTGSGQGYGQGGHHGESGHHYGQTH